MALSFDWSILERRISKLEDVMGSNKLSSQELSKAVHELLDLRQSFHTQLASRPKIEEGIRNYHAVKRLAEEQEGNPRGTSGARSEVLLTELPRLRNLASSTESLQQLEPVLDVKLSDDLSKRMADLGRMKEELLVLMAKMDGVERVHAALSAAETAAVSLTDDKILEIEERMP